MAGLRRSFRWPLENKTTLTVMVPRSGSGFGFTVAWIKPPLVDYIHEGGNAERAGLMPGDKIMSIDKIKVAKKGREEIENIVKNVKEIMELEIVRPESELATRRRQSSLRRKESFTKKGSKMIIRDCNIMLWRRERAILKLLLCEEELLSAVHLGKERFISVLRKHPNLATHAEVDILFGNIEEVACVNERCVQQLREMTQGNHDSVGRLYQRQLGDRCSVLKTYVYGLHVSHVLLKYKLTNKVFREFIEKQEEEDGAIQIAKFLEKPVQYIAAVTSQLETLLACSAVGHADYACLESVVSVYQDFGKEMTEAVDKLFTFVDGNNVRAVAPYDGDDPYVGLDTLQEKALFTKGPRDFSLVHPGRYWLFSGELSKIEGRHYVQYWALLLSDCLILTRRTEQRVLLVLDEPVMLKSIYQATFDGKKCDTEFRVLFALQNPNKSTGQRNQWLTWILRAPSVGIKLLWQTILTYQLSLYSSEALKSGARTSFVHAKPCLGIKELASKRSSNYEESSFVTVTEGTQVSSGSEEMTTGKEFRSIQLRVKGKYILPLVKKTDLIKEISARKCKERSYFSLNENMTSSNDSEGGARVVARSKSFGSDIGDNIPYIDSLDENQQRDTFPVSDEAEGADEDKQQPPRETVSVSGTPQLDDKCVQTDDFSHKPSPKRRFPRLGTFERIKIEKKKASEPGTSKPGSPKARSSFRHRRHIKTTASKELLLKSTAVSSPSKGAKNSGDTSESPFAEPPPAAQEKKKSRGLFSRLFKREQKGVEKSQSLCGEVPMSTLDEVTAVERPPDYESAVRSSGRTPWVCSSSKASL